MKLKDLLESLFDDESASDKAKRAGLIYAGYGRWKDPISGKIIAKSVNGKLLKITGSGERSVPSPSNIPTEYTSEPIAGDGKTGHNNFENDHDSYEDQSSLPQHQNTDELDY